MSDRKVNKYEEPYVDPYLITQVTTNGIPPYIDIRKRAHKH